MNKYDYRVLLRFRHSGSIAENNVISSDIVKVGNDEALQVHKIEIIPPVNGGVIENMFVRLVIDGNEYPGIFLHSTARKIVLGDHKSTDPIANTCPKVGKSLSLQIIGGPGGVTQDFEVRVWGDYFKSDDSLRNFFGATVFNSIPATVQDPFRGKVVSVHHTVPLTISNFTSLPGGGASADKPNVLPIAIYNFNKEATTANVEYTLSSENVLRPQFPLFWDLDEKNAVIIDRIGANIEANGKYVGIKAGNDYYPASNFYVAEPYNEIPLNPDTTTAESLNLLHRSVLITNELGGVFIVDNGTPIDAGKALIGVVGKHIFLG